MKTLVIVNRLAGAGHRKPLDAVPDVRWSGTETEIATPETRAATFDLARDAVAAGARTVVVVGGDGTVNAVLPALSGTGTALAVIPAGSANDLARCHGIPRDASGAWAVAAARKTRSVDLLRVNNRLLATVGGFGFACEVACRANTLRSRHPWLRKLPGLRGSGVYVGAVLAATGTHSRDHTEVTVTAEDFRYSGEFLWFLACNQAFLGRRFRVAPGARSNDGQLDICIALEPSSRLGILPLVRAVTRGRHVFSPMVRMGQARQAIVGLSRPVMFFGDGEPLLTGAAFNLTVLHGALNLVVPSDTEHT